MNSAESLRDGKTVMRSQTPTNFLVMSESKVLSPNLVQRSILSRSSRLRQCGNISFINLFEIGPCKSIKVVRASPTVMPFLGSIGNGVLGCFPENDLLGAQMNFFFMFTPKVFANDATSAARFFG